MFINSSVYFFDADHMKNAFAGEMTQHIICTGCLAFKCLCSDKSFQLMKLGQCFLKARSLDLVALACGCSLKHGEEKKEKEKFMLTLKLLGDIGSLAAVPDSFTVNAHVFSDVTGDMITQENKKRQLSSKLAQNMHLSVFNITISKCLGKCINPPPLTLLPLFSCIRRCMLGYSCMFLL